jgi:hypothetical protein
MCVILMRPRLAPYPSHLARPPTHPPTHSPTHPMGRSVTGKEPVRPGRCESRHPGSGTGSLGLAECSQGGVYVRRCEPASVLQHRHGRVVARVVFVKLRILNSLRQENPVVFFTSNAHALMKTAHSDVRQTCVIEACRTAVESHLPAAPLSVCSKTNPVRTKTRTKAK